MERGDDGRLEGPDPKVPPGRLLALFVIMMAIWLLWSGLFKPLLIGLGVVSCILCVWLAARMPRTDGEALEWVPAGRFFTYIPWLLKEIAIANWDVIRIVLDPKLPIDPVLFTVNSTQRFPYGQVIYGNSITLTPGTITTDIHENVLQVHALTGAGADGLREGTMDRKVTEIEGAGSNV